MINIINVLWAAGGTLGHIVPAFSVIKNCNYNWNNYFICGNKSNELKYIDNNKNYLKDYLSINVLGLDRKWLYLNKNNFKNLRLIKKSKEEVRKYLKENKIDVVIGMGGYISYIVVNEAIKMNIKTIIHEQNAVYGLSNKLLKKKVDKVLTQFDIDKNAICINNPRLTEVRNLVKPKVRCSNFSLLVLGGSNGSKYINDEIIKLSNWFYEMKIKTTLVTGINYYNNNKDIIIKSINPYFNIISFSNNIIELINNSDLVITRSGATTISECLGLCKPMILVPSPNVTNNHQEKNARKLTKKNLAIMIEESLFNSSYIKKTINSYIENKSQLKKIKERIEKYTNVDVITIFKKEVESLINGK